MFSPRQLLAHGVFVEEYRSVADEVRSALPDDRAHLPCWCCWRQMQGKSLNWNSDLSSWDVSRQKIRSVFDQHNLTLKLTFAEFDAARALYPWALDQLTDAYGGIAKLMQPADVGAFTKTTTVRAPGPVTVTARSAADLSGLAAGSDRRRGNRSALLRQRHVCASCPTSSTSGRSGRSDRSSPSLFEADLTDKKNEAVANITRFAGCGRREKELANADYDAKMARDLRGVQSRASRRRRLDRDVHAQARRGLGHARDGVARGRLPDRDVVAGEHGERAEPAPGEQERCGVDDLPGLPEARSRPAASHPSSRTSRVMSALRSARRSTASPRQVSPASTFCFRRTARLFP